MILDSHRVVPEAATSDFCRSGRSLQGYIHVVAETWLCNGVTDTKGGPEDWRPLLFLPRRLCLSKRWAKKMVNQTPKDAGTYTWRCISIRLNLSVHLVSNQKYPKRLTKFFAFARPPLDILIEEQSEMFVAKATLVGGDTKWNSIRLEICNGSCWAIKRKEIVISTHRGYLKLVKLFCKIGNTYSMEEDNLLFPGGEDLLVTERPQLERCTNLLNIPTGG